MKKHFALLSVILMTAAVSRADVSVLALGDSYTAGTGLTSKEKAWPTVLASLVTSGGLKCEEPTVIAKNGWTAAELLAGLDAAKPNRTFDFVIIMIGANNQFRGASVGNFTNELREVLARAQPLAKNEPERVVVVSIPDYGVTPFGKERNPVAIAAGVDAFNKVIRDEAYARNYRFVDVTGFSRMAGSKPDFVSGDGLHPSGKMHSIWARAIFQPLRGTLHQMYRRPKP